MVFSAYKAMNDIVLHVHYGILDERAINSSKTIIFWIIIQLY